MADRRHGTVGPAEASPSIAPDPSPAYAAAPTGEPLNHAALGEALLEVARRRGRATALLWPEGDVMRSMSFADLVHRARAAAEGLLRILSPDERLVIWSANSVNWLVAEIGAALAGIVVVPLNPGLTRHEFGHLLRDSGARAVLTGGPWRGRDLRADAAAVVADMEVKPVVHGLEHWCGTQTVSGDPLPRVDWRQVQRIQYTSGTTGTPKGALITHLMGANVGPIAFRGMQLGAADVICAPVPFHHVGGALCQAHAALLRGATFVLMPQFEPRAAVRMIERAGVTFFGGVPTMLLGMLEAFPEGLPDLPVLRRMMLGGSDVSPELIRTVESAFGVEVFNGYGQSESPASVQTAAGDSDLVKAGTIGRPNAHREVRIADPDTGATLRRGEVGELCMRGPLTIGAYWNATGTVAATDRAGWLHTGDLASMDRDDDVLRMHGRARDVIIRGGENIYPAEVEAVLAQHPDVAEIAVVAAPDPRWGQVPVAFVRPAGNGFDDAELERYGRERLAGFKVPRTWHAVEGFPLTPSGKIQKFRLVERLDGQA